MTSPPDIDDVIIALGQCLKDAHRKIKDLKEILGRLEANLNTTDEEVQEIFREAKRLLESRKDE